MGISDFLRNLLWNEESNGISTIDLSTYKDSEAEFYVNAYCIFSVIDYVAALMSNIELQTYYNGVKQDGLEWHRLNFRPNKNQNAKSFWNEFWCKLLYYQEVLVIPVRNELIIADSFSHHPERAVQEDTFELVSRGDLTFNKTYKMRDVIYLKYSTVDIKNVIGSMLNMYSKMTSHTYKVYSKSGGERGILNVNSAADGPESFEKKYGTWINNRFKSYFEAENAVMPLFKGMTYSGKTGGLQDSSASSMSTLINDALAKACNAYKVPPAVLKGEVAGMGDAFNVLLTTCVDPLAKLLATELTTKEFTADDVVSGCRIKAFTNNIKHTDLFDVTAGFDKLFADGFSHNDLLTYLDIPRINEEWADKHYITKNYETADHGDEGGENI